MKKIFLAVFVSSFCLVSCKKHYSCSCKEVIDGIETNNNGKHVGFRESKKSDAEFYCTTLNTSHTLGSSTIGYDCTLEQ